MDNQVAEVPGLYGSIRMEETVLQRIWNETAFQTDELITEDGGKLEILNPGVWNLAKEGPDFEGAVLRISGRKVVGDVEIHFDSKDWNKHQHHRDPNFNHVVLHVCLFPPETPSFMVATSETKLIPQLSLLSYLYQSLEEYNEGWAMASTSSGEQRLTSNSLISGFKKEIFSLARLRWNEKRRFARSRIKSIGWEQACHQWFVEILGYPRNKMAMHWLANRYRLEDWRCGLNPVAVFEEWKNWKTRGIRPANHPRTRLQQYGRMIAGVPDWPEKLRKLEVTQEASAESTSRRELQLFPLRKFWHLEIIGGNFGPSKSDTLMVDCGLPLWSAFHEIDCFGVWFHWPVGDFPMELLNTARRAGLKKKGESMGNGIPQAMIQNFLLDRERICKH